MAKLLEDMKERGLHKKGILPPNSKDKELMSQYCKDFEI